MIKAAPGNTGLIYIGNDGNGAVSSTTGLALSAGESVVIVLDSLNDLWFDSSVNGGIVHILLIGNTEGDRAG